MITYSVFYHPNIIKKLQKLPLTTRKRILSILELISKNPRDKGLNARKLNRSGNRYIIRLGNVRVFYDVSIKERKVYVWNFIIRGTIN